MKMNVNNFYVFDMDGVMAEYGAVIDGKYHLNLTHSQLCSQGLFLKKRPVLPVIARILTIGNCVYVLTAGPGRYAAEDKRKWLKGNLPWINQENIFVVDNQKQKVNKLETIFSIQKSLNPNIKKSNLILVDDDHEVLKQAESLGYTAWHVSTFLTVNVFE